MRYKHWPRHPFADTSRKRTAVLRHQRSEREALPLFAATIAAEQPAVDDVMTVRAANWTQQERKDRAHRAAKWREARRKLASYSGYVRPALAAYWQNCGWPADPVYLLEMLHMFDTGQLRLPLPRVTTPRTALTWSTLDEWLSCARKIDGRHASALHNRQAELHVRALSLRVIYECSSRATLTACDRLFRYGSTHFCQPCRRQRQNAPQTALIIAIHNRMAQIDRAEDHASIGIGHNSRAAGFDD